MSVRTGLEATTSKFENFFALNCKLADIIIILYYTLPVLCYCGLVYQVDTAIQLRRWCQRYQRYR